MFEPAIEQLLTELEELGRENDQRVSERRYKLLNLERPTAELIWLLLQSTRRRRVLDHRRRHRAFDDERFGPRHPRADGGDNERAAQGSR